MIELATPLPDVYEDIRDTYDLVSDPDAVLLTTVSTYKMGRADEMLAWYTGEGSDAADRGFFEYFQNFYPTLEQQAPLELAVDEALGVVSLTGRYRIPDAWTPLEDDDGEYLYIDADDLYQDMPRFVGTPRTMTYALSHPVRSRQTLIVHLDDNWDVENTTDVIETHAFRFSNVERFFNNILFKEVTYTSKASEIAPDDFRGVMGALRTAHDLTGITLTVSE